MRPGRPEAGLGTGAVRQRWPGTGGNRRRRWRRLPPRHQPRRRPRWQPLPPRPLARPPPPHGKRRGRRRRRRWRPSRQRCDCGRNSPCRPGVQPRWLSRQPRSRGRRRAPRNGERVTRSAMRSRRKAAGPRDPRRARMQTGPRSRRSLKKHHRSLPRIGPRWAQRPRSRKAPKRHSAPLSLPLPLPRRLRQLLLPERQAPHGASPGVLTANPARSSQPRPRLRSLQPLPRL
mmetsp:Transcript_44775/g.124497  ORF Transcript_44775/g.124497 Transcript_44775/m.124497 type:complete len:231 (+) Transcript_44775:740-1432(+)